MRPLHLILEQRHRLRTALVHLAVLMLAADALHVLAHLPIGSDSVCHGLGSCGAFLGALIPYFDKVTS